MRPGRGGPPGKRRIAFHPFLGGPAAAVLTLEGEPACGEAGLTVSADGRRLAYVEQVRSSDVMMVEGFR